MVPFFFLYRKSVIPYFVALLSHSLIGDLVVGGVQLFWPLSTMWVGVFNISVTSSVNGYLEFILFIVSLGVLIKTGDLRRMGESRKKLVLFLPFMTVLAPLLGLGLGFEYAIPSLLIIPSLFWLSLFIYSVISHYFLRKHKT